MSESTSTSDNSTPKIAHDKFLRAVFKDEKHCVDLFRLAPNEKEFDAFDCSTLSIATDILFTFDWNKRRPDLLVSVDWKRSSRRLQLISVIEHKSRRDSDVQLQLHEYCAVILRAQRQPVLPIIVYSGFRRKWKKPLRLHDSLVRMPPEKKKDV